MALQQRSSSNPPPGVETWIGTQGWIKMFDEKIKLAFDEEIKLAKEKIEKTTAALESAKSELQVLNEQKAFAEFGVKLGSLIFDKRSKTKFVVTDIDTKFSRPWLSGRKIKKDGTPSKAITWIGVNWELVEKE